MFCPKCGNQLPDGSAFCGKCGAQVGASAATGLSGVGRQGHGPCPTGASRPAGAVGAGLRSASGVSPAAVVAAVLAAVAALVTLVPWFGVLPAYSALTGYVGEAASLFGLGSESSLAFEESYDVWGLPALAGTFGEYASLYGSLGGEGADAAAVLVSAVAWGCAALCLLAVALLAWGAVDGLRKGTKGKLVAGAVMAVVAFAAFQAFASLAGDLGQATMFPAVFLAASLGALACSFALKR